MFRISRKVSAAAVLMLAALLMLSASHAQAASARVEISESVVSSDAITVTARIVPDDKYVTELEHGVTKEVLLFVDVFQVWELWPDEFLHGRSFTRTLRCDPVKKEYVGTSLEGTKQIERRFKDCSTLREWALSAQGIKLPLPKPSATPGSYYVKVITEGRRGTVPPVVGMLFFFVKDNEFAAESHTEPFNLPGNGSPAQGGRP